jgi:hypothetical protein
VTLVLIVEVVLVLRTVLFIKIYSIIWLSDLKNLCYYVDDIILLRGFLYLYWLRSQKVSHYVVKQCASIGSDGGWYSDFCHQNGDPDDFVVVSAWKSGRQEKVSFVSDKGKGNVKEIIGMFSRERTQEMKIKLERNINLTIWFCYLDWLQLTDPTKKKPMKTAAGVGIEIETMPTRLAHHCVYLKSHKNERKRVYTVGSSLAERDIL